MDEADCRHHYMLDPAFEGQPSAGTCKLCGNVKMFKNSIEDQDKTKLHLGVSDRIRLRSQANLRGDIAWAEIQANGRYNNQVQ